MCCMAPSEMDAQKALPNSSPHGRAQRVSPSLNKSSGLWPSGARVVIR